MLLFEHFLSEYFLLLTWETREEENRETMEKKNNFKVVYPRASLLKG